MCFTECMMKVICVLCLQRLPAPDSLSCGSHRKARSFRAARCVKGRVCEPFGMKVDIRGLRVVSCEMWRLWWRIRERVDQRRDGVKIRFSPPASRFSKNKKSWDSAFANGGSWIVANSYQFGQIANGFANSYNFLPKSSKKATPHQRWRASVPQPSSPELWTLNPWNPWNPEPWTLNPEPITLNSKP
jgi:hypothetical protein